MGEVRKVFLCLFGIVALWGIVYYLLNRPVVDHDVAVAGNARLTILKWVGIVFLCAIAFLVMAALRYLCFRWQHHVRREEAKTKKLEEEARIAKEMANSIQGEAKQKNAVGDRAYGMIPYLLRLQATMTVREEGFTPYLIGREHALTETAWQGVWSAQLDNERKRLELPYVSRSENEWVQDLREPLGTRPILANYRSAKEPPPQLVPPEANFMPPKLDLYTILAQEGRGPNESGIFLARGSINNSATFIRTGVYTGGADDTTVKGVLDVPTAKSLDESLLVEAGASYCRADGIPVQPARIPYASHKAIYHLLGTPTIPLPDHELSVAELEHSSELLADELADSYGSYAPYEVSTEEVSGDVGKNGKNVVRADGEPGKNPVRTRDVLTEEVRISDEIYRLIVDAASRQMRETRAFFVNKSKLVETLRAETDDPCWNTKRYKLISYVLDQERIPHERK